MRILVTADAVGGVWIYTRELVSGLVQRGHFVILVSFGSLPRPDQLLWLRELDQHRLEFHATEFPLEWMQEAECGIAESLSYLERLIHESKPDLLHSSQYCYGAVSCGVPKLVVAHSDVRSWWKAVHGKAPPDSAWLDWYTATVSRGLSSADAVVAPSQWMLDTLAREYGSARRGRVIYNGRNPALFRPAPLKHKRVVSVGRLWDEGKQVRLLLERKHALPVHIAGPNQHPDRTGIHLDPAWLSNPGVKISDTQSETDLCTLFSEASVYAATSRYEPFGLAPVEAALSCCALVVNDIPVFHELWEDCALYFKRNDPDALAEAIRELAENTRLREQYADRAFERARSRFDSKRMVDDYEALYYEVASKGAAA
jgi:glycogen synthase